MTETKIEWTHAPGFKGESWNPMVGCSIVSPGCTNCYAMKQAARIEMMTPGSHYAGTTKNVNGNAVWTGKIAKAREQTLRRPLGQKKPRMYFVNSMSDLFHEDAPEDWLDEIFAVMGLSPQHKFLVLTKRAERMRTYVSHETTPGRVYANAMRIGATKPLSDRAAAAGRIGAWPLPNVWLGVTAEDQKHADLRIPDVLMTPAAKRFVSYEPAIGPIDFSSVGNAYGGHGCDALAFTTSVPALGARYHHERLDWIIAGGESGPGARPANPDWFRSVRDECSEAEVPFFLKQWGEYMPVLSIDGAAGPLPNSRLPEGAGSEVVVDRWVMRRVGKKAAGASLDGREHKEWPL